MRAKVYDIIDPEMARLEKRNRWLLMMSIVISIFIFAWPHVDQFHHRWMALVSARKVATYIQGLKSRAIISRKPIEIRFISPKKMEVSEVSSCGTQASRVKIEERSLDEIYSQIEFLSPQWVHSHLELKDALLGRFCYDPQFGSSLAAEGIMHGAVFLAHSSDPVESSVRLEFVGPNGDIELE